PSPRSPFWSTARQFRRNRAGRSFFRSTVQASPASRSSMAPAPRTAWSCAPRKALRLRRRSRRRAPPVRRRLAAASEPVLPRRGRFHYGRRAFVGTGNDMSTGGSAALWTLWPANSLAAIFDFAASSNRRALAVLAIVSVIAFVPGIFQIPPVDRD